MWQINYVTLKKPALVIFSSIFLVIYCQNYVEYYKIKVKHLVESIKLNIKIQTILVICSISLLFESDLIAAKLDPILVEGAFFVLVLCIQIVFRAIPDDFQIKLDPNQNTLAAREISVQWSKQETNPSSIRLQHPSCASRQLCADWPGVHTSPCHNQWWREFVGLKRRPRRHLPGGKGRKSAGGKALNMTRLMGWGQHSDMAGLGDYILHTHTKSTCCWSAKNPSRQRNGGDGLM